MSSSAPLSLDRIRSTLATESLGHVLYLHQDLPSTNAEAGSLVRTGARHGTVVLAESQSSGYGRHGRAWFSPPGLNIYCSVIIRGMGDNLSLSQWLSWVPLVSALAVSEAVQQTAAVSLSLKWPNDLLFQERKVGGILCESSLTPTNDPAVVIGIGLNVNVPSLSFPEELRPIAASLLDASRRPIDRNRLIAQLLLELEQCLGELRSSGPVRLRQAYTARCATLGRHIRVLFTNDPPIIGIAEALSADGALQVRTAPTHLRSQPMPLVDVRAADVIHLRE
ncbi:biotin--[acetyl-CoA-carboxylase] ligase [Candidatus Nitrospira nitrificans]|uniref:biotin--[biotin carboxyl-carrier protein] ligase n=1 Tax=Candidatus Nitrospira nitrificans TaxID=1742973 RepID=A0A0S4LV96_9BACT|nr:biotin--[acetyl-CoA-carboxylase] ligase [Candidatus Nitrospira nitrificans]CUS38930.1 putative Biotin-(Acetyl-CoA-carboxylase) ligase [Candidatus Nitrospira nitrificans]